jgi:ribokinase
MGVVVFGSINIDLVVRLPRLPKAGETLTGHSFFTAPGGKGANQAVAAARMGAATSMIGRVGGDVFGDALLAALQDDQVNTVGVSRDDDQPSGVALITVDDSAENRIIVVPGANGVLGEDDLRRLDQALARAHVLLLQLEVPLDAVLAAARLARQHSVTVLLDPAPARVLPPELYKLVDILTPNEVEATMLAGEHVHRGLGVARIAQVLLDRGVRTVIVKMADQGVYWADRATAQFAPAFPVEAVDTVAAGDAFNGALAAALAEGLAFPDALRWGLAAGALAVTKPGAQPSLPRREEVLALAGQGTPTLR